MSIYTPI